MRQCINFFDFMKKVFLLVAVVGLFVGCVEKGKLLPNASGTAFEVLVVIDDNDWKNPCGKVVFDMLNTDVPNLPQAEPMFKISHVPHANFDSYLRPARNLIIVSISPEKYTQAKVVYSEERWAKTQAIVSLNAPTQAELTALVEKEQENIIRYFVEKERERFANYLKKKHNSTFSQKAYEKFGIEINVPSDMCQIKEGKNFLWFTNASPKTRQDIVIYSYPYTSEDMFTLDRLVATRDSVLKENVPGPEKDSYMGTETYYEKPVLNEFLHNEAYCAEVRGLWKIYNGSLMGGPFVSLSRLDEIHQRIVTIEGFVFAPGKDKRNYIRQLEAAIYSAKMPQEINQIVVKKKK